MRETKKEVRTVEDEVITKCTCDICGQESVQPFDDPDQWGRFASSSVEMTEGTSYGSDGGSTVTTRFDICPKCFKEELIPYISRRRNIEPEKIEKDW
jgi:hypothetical protein